MPQKRKPYRKDYKMQNGGPVEQWDLREYMHDRNPAIRKCIQCRKPFQSKSSSNRICTACKDEMPTYPGKLPPKGSGRTEDHVMRGM